MGAGNEDIPVNEKPNKRIRERKKKAWERLLESTVHITFLCPHIKLLGRKPE
jgi:hypothetical protein